MTSYKKVPDMKFKKLSEIANCLGVCSKDIDIDGFAIDSRLVKKGNLFFALKGNNFDGHDFLEEVAKKGAPAAIVESHYEGKTCGLILIKVPNVTEAIQKLAQIIQSQRKQKIIGITGSVGKTTTKEFLSILLSEKYNVSKTPGNQNSQLGLPLSILNAQGTEEFFIAEMGMTHFGHIRRLVEIAPPDIGLITKIGYSHVESFSNGLEGIAKAKMEIFSHPYTKLGVVNAQVLGFKAAKSYQNKIQKSYALEPIQADYILEKGWCIREENQYSPTFQLPFYETHFCEDFIGAVAIARLLNLSWTEIINGIQNLKTIKLRFEKIEKEGITFINDTYNNSPEAMICALNNLPLPGFGGKIVAVLGEMRYLGNFSEKMHRYVGQVAIDKVDHLLCYGKGCLPMMDVFQKSGKPVEMFHELRILKLKLFEMLKKGDVVLLRGSNPVKLWQILEN